MEEYYYSQEYYYYPQQYQPQWVELIVPVMAGIMLLVFIMGMVRDLIKGKEVKLP